MSQISGLLLAVSVLVSTASAMVIDLSKENITAEAFLASRDAQLMPGNVLPRAIIGDAPQNCRRKDFYTIVGDGNPHQNYVITQMKDTITGCPGSVSQGHSHTTSWSVGFGANPGYKAWDFASFSFSVSESDTESLSTTFTCDGDFDSICALHYTAVTAITVDFHTKFEGCDDPQDDQDHGRGVVYLPNANGIGSFIRRGANNGAKNMIQCYGNAERTINFYCGPKGSADWFRTHAVGPDSAAYLGAKEPANCDVPIEAYNWKD